MKRKVILFIALTLIGFVSLANISSVKADIAVGATLEDFKLPDVNGKEQSFKDLKGKNGAILVFLSTQCPVVRGYNERLGRMAEDYAAQGISVIGVNANATESPETVKAHTAEHYKFPVLIDKGNVLADRLGASATPETFYFDANGKLIYRGAIDNDRTGKNVTENFLRDALDANLGGKIVTKTKTLAIGCTIRRVEKN